MSTSRLEDRGRIALEAAHDGSDESRESQPTDSNYAPAALQRPRLAGVHQGRSISEKGTVKMSTIRILRRMTVAIVGFAMFVFGSPAHAALLNVSAVDPPDILAGFLTITYDASTDAFSASGWASQLDDGGAGSPHTITGVRTFDITGVSIDDSGNASGGTLDIRGTISDLGFNSGTLLTGTLGNFGFSPLGGVLEFLFDVTGGDAASLYGNAPALVIVTTGAFEGNFDNDFNNSSGVADVVATPIPAPAAALLGLIGLGLTVQMRRRHVA